MAFIDGFRIRNYRSLKDVILGTVFDSEDKTPLTPLTTAFGQNEPGLNALLDAFDFLKDCFDHDVEAACDLKQRGGFHRLHPKGAQQPIGFEIDYRETLNDAPISYLLFIDVDQNNRPIVAHESLVQRKSNQGSEVSPTYFLDLFEGQGAALPEVTGSAFPVSRENTSVRPIALANPRELGLVSLGDLAEYPEIQRFRDFFSRWSLSYLYLNPAHGSPVSGAKRQLSAGGGTLGSMIQRIQRQHKDQFQSILTRIAKKIPGIDHIETTVTEDKRVLLRFNDTIFEDPFLSSRMFDGIPIAFAYLLLLEDPDRPPFICIGEPEIGVNEQLLASLVQEFQARATGEENAPQIFLTTQHPDVVNALRPEEIWTLMTEGEGVSTVSRDSES